MRKLTLELIDTVWGKLLRVKEQTHRGNEFTDSGNRFVFNGFTLVSSDFPCSADGTLLVLGTVQGYDRNVIYVPSELWLQGCREAVRAYNETYADKETLPTSGVETIQ